MKQPEYQGNEWIIHASDCVEGMWSMPENSVDCAIFSPPFGDLFVYSDSERDLGNAGEGEAFAEQYAYFAEALTRVLRPGRIACVHCTDLPMRKSKHGAVGLQDFSGDLVRAHTAAGLIYHGRATIWKDPVVEMQRTKAIGLLYKQIRKDSAFNRVGMPDYMLFFRKDGPNDRPVSHGAPESEEARKVAREWFDDLRRQGLCAETPDDELLEQLTADAEFDVYHWQRIASPVWMDIHQGNVLRNYRDAKGPDDEKHVCPLQLDVIRKCLRLYTRPGDVVMDPFNGIGSTGYEAVKARRKYVGFELKPEYAAQANRNLQQAEGSSLDLFAAE
ncbi:DNA-methyltransferase [Tranquillimonas rosea]|uniref:DNA-methyltransferase n=1 Tax=Tranquillimonas rosea TaxID=641238 RepID=UPI003BAB5F7B